MRSGRRDTSARHRAGRDTSARMVGGRALPRARADNPPIIEDTSVRVRGTWLPPVRAGGVAAVTAAAVRPDGGVEAE